MNCSEYWHKLKLGLGWVYSSNYLSDDYRKAGQFKLCEDEETDTSRKLGISKYRRSVKSSVYNDRECPEYCTDSWSLI